MKKGGNQIKRTTVQKAKDNVFSMFGIKPKKVNRLMEEYGAEAQKYYQPEQDQLQTNIEENKRRLAEDFGINQEDLARQFGISEQDLNKSLQRIAEYEQTQLAQYGTQSKRMQEDIARQQQQLGTSEERLRQDIARQQAINQMNQGIAGEQLVSSQNERGLLSSGRKGLEDQRQLFFNTQQNEGVEQGLQRGLQDINFQRSGLDLGLQRAQQDLGLAQSQFGQQIGRQREDLGTQLGRLQEQQGLGTQALQRSYNRNTYDLSDYQRQQEENLRKRREKLQQDLFSNQLNYQFNVQ